MWAFAGSHPAYTVSTCWLSSQHSIENMYEFAPLLYICQWHTYKSAVAQSFVSVAEADASWYRPWHCQHEAPPLLPPSKALIVKGQHPSLDQCSSVWHHCSDSPSLSPLTSLSRLWSFRFFQFFFSLSQMHQLTSRPTQTCKSCKRDPVYTGMFVPSCLLFFLVDFMWMRYVSVHLPLCVDVPCCKRLDLSVAMSSVDHVIWPWPSGRTITVCVCVCVC